VWDAATGTILAELRGHTRGVRCAAFSPDGTRIVTASWDNTARVWDAATGSELSILGIIGVGNALTAVFCPLGKHIFTFYGGKIQKWGS